MAKKNAKKNARVVKGAKPTTIEITILDGVNISDEESLTEALEYLAEAQAQMKKVENFIQITKNHATTYMNSHALPVVQMDGHYWRKIQRMTRFFVLTPAEMPDPAPRGAKSLKELCQGKTVKSGKPLWGFITKRVLDPAKLDEAVNLGYISQKEIDKAWLESPQKPFIQKFDGEALDAEDQ